MIPKTIHYCWLSGDPFPESIQICMESWKKIMPEYEIKCWNMDNFDIHSVKFVEEACEKRKWAFAADYIRLYALYTEGGIYLDSDVLIKKTMNDFLDYDFFSAVEYHPHCFKESESAKLLNIRGELLNETTLYVPGMQIQAAVLGGVKGHPYLRKCLDYYEQNSFVFPDGSLRTQIIAPDILARIAVDWGFLYKDDYQKLKDDMLLLPSKKIASRVPYATKEAYAIHCCVGSWKMSTKTKIIHFFSKIFHLFCSYSRGANKISKL